MSFSWIINDILDFSKIEAGKLDLEQTPFFLDEVMENLANLLGLKAEEKASNCILIYHLIFLPA